MTTGDRTVPLPRPPEQEPTPPFPVLATLAPVIASLALFVFTKSPFVLVFAVLGPIVALASMVDSRRRAVLHRRAEDRRFEREVRATRDVVLLEHHRERERLAQLAPRAAQLVHGDDHAHSRWQRTILESVPVTLGTGRVSIELISRQDERSFGVDAGPEHDRAGAANEPSRVLGSLITEAAVIECASIIVDARQGIAIVGPQAQSVAVLNGLVLQVAHALSPRDVVVCGSPHQALEWLRDLPHTRRDSVPKTGSDSELTAIVEFQSRTGDAVIRIAAGEAGGVSDQGCSTLLRVGGGSAPEVVRAPQRSEFSRVTPEFISTAQAMSFATALSIANALDDTSTDVPPDRVDFSQLGLSLSTVFGSLACPVGVGANGQVSLDLVADGPHAIIGGTTGSGKSELLIAWVLAMAATFSTDAVNFLLVDFKGGASFTALASLPHCVGVVTDLGHSGAKRALESLSAELRRREQVLAAMGAASIDDVQHSLARLVIVVDEFATVAARLPELQDLFSDIASRGRSLGVHLILCTQRPVGVMRDAVLANCALRISLRVNNSADSVAVIGSTMAAELPRKHAGRGIVVTDDGGVRAVQFAVVCASDIDEVRSRWPLIAVNSPSRPWREPLAATIRFDELDGFDAPYDEHGVAFAVVDLPAEQRQQVLNYDVSAQGSMLIVGAHRAGKTGVLAAVGEAAARQAGTSVTWLPSGLEGAWDAVAAQLASIRRGAPEPTLLLLDDVDSLIGLLGDQVAHNFVESLVAIIREGGAHGVHLVVATTRISAGIQAVAHACASTLLLRAAAVEDHVLAGGDRATFDPRLPAGGGFWRGDRIQVVRAGTPVLPAIQPTPELAVARTLVVVSSSPGAILGRLNALGVVSIIGESMSHDVDAITVFATSGADSEVDRAADRGADPDAKPTPRILLGDPNSWQNAWALLTTLRSSAPIAFHLCTSAQYRMFTNASAPPPPLAQPEHTVWLSTPDGRVSRALLPRADLSEH